MEIMKIINKQKLDISEPIFMRLLRLEKKENICELQELLQNESLYIYDDNTIKIKTSNNLLLEYMLTYMKYIRDISTGCKHYPYILKIDAELSYETLRITERFYSGFGNTYLCKIESMNIENGTIILKNI